MFALNAGRRMAESRMTDECGVTRAGEKTWNETTGEYENTPTSVYSGKCRIRHSAPNGKDVDAAGRLLTISSLELHVPVGTAVFEPDDVVAITASGTRSDQVGRKFIVLAPFDGSQTTALRYKIEAYDER